MTGGLRGGAAMRPADRTPSPGRLHFVDAARSLAVACAMYSHALLAFGVWDRDTASLLRYLFQAAPPLFIMMFGMMLEVVYVPRLEQGRGGPVVRRFLTRSAQCYLGYAATAAAAYLAGLYSARAAGGALLLRRTVPYSSILVFYTFALLAAGPLLRFRRRFGLPGLAALLALIWASRPLLAALDLPRGPWFTPAGALLGVAGRPAGPSVLFGLSFVLVGMIAAEPLRERRRAGFAPFRRRLGLLALLAAVVLALALARESPDRIGAALTSYASYARDFRRAEHPGYYAAGVLLALGWLALLLGVVPRDRPLPGWAGAALEFGRSALLAFSLGNVVLILLPREFLPQTRAGGHLAALVFVVALLALLRALARARVALARAPGPGAAARGS